MSKTVIGQTIDSERLKWVTKNRQLQLQRWICYENELQKIQNSDKVKKNDGKKHIAFGNDVILLEAISRNDIKEVNELLSEGVNPNSATVDGLTGLHQCCIDDMMDMAELLIRYNANVNARDSEMWTPLHAAATCDNAAMCVLLSKHNCDFLALNADGNMPYDICEGDNSQKIIESEMDKRGITQEQIDDARAALEQHMLRDVRLIYQNKGDLNELDVQGAALIHVASSLGYKEVIQTLLESGANYSLPDKDGWLPIHLAGLWNQVDIIEILVVFGADIDACNPNGDTIFEICEPEVKDRLQYIKDNIADLRKNYDFNRLLPHKGFRRSRGSSVRRSSVRQKSMLSKKEAKEEFIAMTTTVTSTEDSQHLSIEGSLAHVPWTIEECIDVDNPEVRPTPCDMGIKPLDIENGSSGMISIAIPNIETLSSTKPISHSNSSLCDQRQESSNVRIITQDHNNNGEKKVIRLNGDTRSKIAHDTKSEVVLAKGEEGDVRMKVLKSTKDNWEDREVCKGRRRMECCVLL